MTIKVDFRGTHEGAARAMDAAPVVAGRLITLNGKRYRYTPDVLINGIVQAMRPIVQAKAYDQGLRAGANIAASRALAGAVLASNRSGQVARAIDVMFDTMPNSRSMSVAQAVDSLDAEPLSAVMRNMPMAKALDHLIDGTSPAQQDSAANVIDSI